MEEIRTHISTDISDILADIIDNYSPYVDNVEMVVTNHRQSILEQAAVEASKQFDYSVDDILAALLEDTDETDDMLDEAIDEWKFRQDETDEDDE